ncbi:hypothetical protein [Pseudomonas sp. S36]|nr:hypothetical protein [Pseudomonas sp. S36]MBK4988190.1 hypothetical protein [Pseudomonas sp. S36]
MKELTCFAIGLVVGVLLMTKSQTVDDLKRELERERERSTA